MKQSRVDVGTIRREQIVEAAVAIIAEQGIQNLSLSEIEKRAEMSRGQLTYYFHTKEDILLAVFDRMMQMMRERAKAGEGPMKGCSPKEPGWNRLEHILNFMLRHLPAEPTFSALQHTFLSQIAHRDDFRQRLASLYEEWRSNIVQDVTEDLSRRSEQPIVSARTVASLVQAILHGLITQRIADPNAFDKDEMSALCVHLLGNYLRPEATASQGSNGTTSGARQPPSVGKLQGES